MWSDFSDRSILKFTAKVESERILKTVILGEGRSNSKVTTSCLTLAGGGLLFCVTL